MDYEQKYKKALERAKEIHDEQRAQPFNVMTRVFPELKESKNEGIREALLNYLKEASYGKTLVVSTLDYKRWADWLEKQGEQKPYGQRQECSNCQFNYAGECKGSCAMKRGEQKPAVEMKTPEESLGIDSDTYNKIVDECVYGEKNHSWTEEDETALSDALWCCKQAASIAKDENDMGNAWYAENWLKSLKDKVQPQQEWSEEDEYKYNTILHHLDLRKEKYKKECNQEEQDRYQCLYDWLKSLKERYTWKPNEKQMHYLSWIANIKLGDSVVEQEVSKHLNELYKDLKKLMEK